MSGRGIQVPKESMHLILKRQHVLRERKGNKEDGTKKEIKD